MGSLGDFVGLGKFVAANNLKWTERAAKLGEFIGQRLIKAARSPILSAGQHTIESMKKATGAGTPENGHRFTAGADTLGAAGQVLATAFPDDTWDSSGAAGYTGRNTEQVGRVRTMLELDQTVAGVLSTEARQIAVARDNLDGQADWLGTMSRLTTTAGAFPGFGQAAAMAAEFAMVAKAVHESSHHLETLRGQIGENAAVLNNVASQYDTLAAGTTVEADGFPPPDGTTPECATPAATVAAAAGDAPASTATTAATASGGAGAAPDVAGPAGAPSPAASSTPPSGPSAPQDPAQAGAEQAGEAAGALGSMLGSLMGPLTGILSGVMQAVGQAAQAATQAVGQAGQFSSAPLDDDIQADAGQRGDDDGTEDDAEADDEADEKSEEDGDGKETGVGEPGRDEGVAVTPEPAARPQATGETPEREAAKTLPPDLDAAVAATAVTGPVPVHVTADSEHSRFASASAATLYRGNPDPTPSSTGKNPGDRDRGEIHGG